MYVIFYQAIYIFRQGHHIRHFGPHAYILKWNSSLPLPIKKDHIIRRRFKLTCWRLPQNQVIWSDYVSFLYQLSISGTTGNPPAPNSGSGKPLTSRHPFQYLVLYCGVRKDLLALYILHTSCSLSLIAISHGRGTNARNKHAIVHAISETLGSLSTLFKAEHWL